MVAQRSEQDYDAEIAKLRAELASANAALEVKSQLKFKVSEKGALSVYGLQARFPVTLYIEQWQRLISALPELKAFATAHRSEFSHKPAAPVQVSGTVVPISRGLDASSLL